MKKAEKIKKINNSEYVIRLVNVSKRYTLHHEKPTLTERLFKGKTEEFWALKNINLTISKGEKIGIIGSNGSGKTTLLKIICGITTPTSGITKTIGKIVSLIDLEAGFHPDLTGEQNIFLNGALLGMSKDEIKYRLRAIIDFADVGQFIDAPLFTYSAGMKLRLGFSVAIHAEPDMLLLDEGVSIGDAKFQNKVKSELKRYFSLNRTVLVVSHQLEFIRHSCQRIVLLRHGKIIENSDFARAKKRYMQFY